MGLQQHWSTTAADNDDADSTVNWLEGQAPSTVNGSARAMMTALKKTIKDLSGAIVTGGSSTAYTVTTNEVWTALSDGLIVGAEMHATNGASPTLNVDSLGAKDIKLETGVAPSAGMLKAGGKYLFCYDSSATAWVVLGPSLSINGLTEDTAPVTGDFVATYDTSATAHKKVNVSKLGSLPQLTRIATDVYIAPRGTSTTLALTANTLYVVPIFVGKGGTAINIGIEVTSASAGNARLGIYTHGATSLLPTTLILDAGTVSTGTTGVKEITISQAVSDNTYYWGAIVSDATPTVRAVGTTVIAMGFASLTGSAFQLSRSFTYAALPADESAQTYTVAAANTPMVWLRG